MLGWIVTAVLIGIVIGIGMPSMILGLAHIYEQRILGEERGRAEYGEKPGSQEKQDASNAGKLHQKPRRRHRTSGHHRRDQRRTGTRHHE